MDLDELKREKRAEIEVLILDESKSYGELLGVITLAKDLSESSKVCRRQCRILGKAFECVLGVLERLGDAERKDFEFLILPVVWRALHLLKSCQGSDWIVWGLLFEEGHQEFQSIYREICDCINTEHLAGKYQSEFYRENLTDLLEKAGMTDRKKLTILAMGDKVEEAERNSAKYILALKLLVRYPTIDGRALSRGRLLGSGTHSKVYEATWLDHKFAIKEFPCGSEAIFDKEFKILRTHKHPNVLHVAGHTVNKSTNQYSLVMEKMDMDLKDYIQQRYEQLHHLMPLQNAVEVLLQIATGMEWLHSRYVIHRDLKPENVLVGEAHGVLSVRIADFASSRPDSLSMVKDLSITSYGDYEHDDDPEYTGKRGTKGFMAPEVWKCELYSRKADVYSYGMLCYQLCTGNITLQEVDVDMEQVVQGKRPEIPSSCPGFFSELIQDCWSHDPDKRPEFSVICQRLRYLKTKKYATDRDITTVSRKSPFPLQIEAGARLAHRPSDPDETGWKHPSTVARPAIKELSPRLGSHTSREPRRRHLPRKRPSDPETSEGLCWGSRRV